MWSKVWSRLDQALLHTQASTYNTLLDYKGSYGAQKALLLDPNPVQEF